MRVYQKLFVLLGVAFTLTAYAIPEPLTPPHEPKDNSFYICYDERRVSTVIYDPFVNYEKYQYVGCMISRTSCCNYEVREKNKLSTPLKLFGWFDNYPQALNAFYRCAYSG